VLLLLALLTWLLLRGTAYAVTLRDFDDFALAEPLTTAMSCKVCAGLLPDYDTLVKTAAAATEDAVTRLRSYAQSEDLDAGPADR
jgi:hypothetical protein